jgi:light-regulated signal transduction histidine kinase (bacteriophytochrome)
VESAFLPPISTVCSIAIFRGSNVSSIVGTGIGLYLVKIVADLHGDAISVDSHEGQGARFTISLPIKFRANDVDLRASAADREEEKGPVNLS